MTSVHVCLTAAVLAIAAVVASAAPSIALAEGEPQITSAGIDAEDRVYATWTLAPGTTFDTIDVSSSSILDPDTNFDDFADVGSFAGYDCAPPPEVCQGSPTKTSYRELYPVARDRRYHVIVNAKAGDRLRTSAMWVIDGTKPLIPGDNPIPESPSNAPAIGIPFVPPAPDTIPAPVLSLPAPTPATIAGFLRRGLRVRLTCRLFECYAPLVALGTGAGIVASASASVRPGGRRTIVLRPSKTQRAKLRRRSRLRLKLGVEILQPTGKRTAITRSITLRG
jgi:hypothetical protein